MIPEYRRDFNQRFTPEKYRRFLSELDRRSGAPVKFRCSETPVFFPRELLRTMEESGKELVAQLIGNPEYLAAADESIPMAFRVPRVTPRPLFVQADFGIVRGPSGNWEPKLVEIQGFPSLYGFQPVLAETYRDAYELDPSLCTLLSGLGRDQYETLLRQAIVGDYDPAEVVLLEVDPEAQKTLADFRMTEKICGIPTVDIRDVRKSGKQLFYLQQGRQVPIRRIYNRAIADELIRLGTHLDFAFTDDLDVDWAGHPNWFFRISKFSLPWLKHPCVPRTWFLSDAIQLPADPEDLVLKPLYSFAGLGVTIGPSAQQIDAVPLELRSEYILQERMDFEATIHTPPGPAKAEVRVMYIWADELTAVTTIIRTGRGKMMGVDHNRNLEWVGASAGFFPC